MTIAVLGGTGFVGSAVSARLTAAGHDVRVVARGTSTEGAGVYRSDLTEPGAVAAAVAGCEAVLCLVLHSGGWRIDVGDRAAAADVNVGVVEAACATGLPVLLAGSTSQPGVGAGERLTGPDPDPPASEYDRQKAAAERVTLDSGGTCLRLPTVYGPGPTDRGVVSTMVRRAVRGEALTVWGTGEMLRDLVHVDDVASAFVRAVEHRDALSGRRWSVGSGTGVSVLDLFTLIADTVAAHTGRAPVPVRCEPPPRHATTVDLGTRIADPSALRAACGWRATVSLDDGVAELVTATLARLARP